MNARGLLLWFKEGLENGVGESRLSHWRHQQQSRILWGTCSWARVIVVISGWWLCASPCAILHASSHWISVGLQSNHCHYPLFTGETSKLRVAGPVTASSHHICPNPSCLSFSADAITLQGGHRHSPPVNKETGLQGDGILCLWHVPSKWPD